MKLKYGGKFNGDEKTLPHGEHQPNTVKFKEAEDVNKFGIVLNIISMIITIPLMAYIGFYSYGQYIQIGLGAIATTFILVPHELLHAICFNEEVYFYHFFSKGLMFVVGPESMTRKRFVFMSLLPNVIFGFIPFLIYCFYPKWVFLGTFGAVCIGMGVGDYYNVYNALTQMPKGAYTYLYQFHSYWYMPEEKLP